MTDQFDELRRAVGQRVSTEDVVSASQIGRLAGALGVAHPAPNPGDAVPHDWHTVFFPRLAALDELREDGAPQSEEFEVRSPLEISRQLGRRSTYHDALRIGDNITRVTEVSNIAINEAQPAALITIRDTITTPRGVAVIDERDRITFGPEGPGDLMPVLPEIPDEASWRRSYDPTAVMMFRLSAVRYNGHRIHYDRDYATEVEGLPGLVVPHTLISALMLEMLRAQLPDRDLARFSYQSIKRIYDLGAYEVCGKVEEDHVTFWASDQEGAACTIGEAELRAT
ncbi:MAG: hypothetical protein O3A84_00715 [Proteobacteria bacterium]|nr:hypothetical protein [Pseudomonadota bacterium]